MRSESCSFIWHPKVRTKKRAPVTAPVYGAPVRDARRRRPNAPPEAAPSGSTSARARLALRAAI